MRKYFRTLLKLIRFFFEDDILFTGDRTNDSYYSVIKIARKLLKKQLLSPFVASKTIKVNSNYALTFQDWILMPYKKYPNLEQVLSERFLWDFGFKATNVVFNNGTISSFTYTYN